MTYDGNGNTGGTVPGEQIWLKGAAATITIAANSFERTGYSFNGWNTATGTAYAAGDTYSTDAALTLYAQWTANTYTVTLDNQSATTAGAAAIYEKYGSGYYTDSTASTKMTATENPITMPAKTGYSFGGYYTGTGGAGTQYIDAAGKITASADATNFAAAGTLYAKWTANTYKVAFMANGGDGSMADESFTYGTTQALTAITFTYENYTFCGWATTDTSTAPEYYDQKKVLNLTTEADGTVTLYAIWINNTDNTAPVTLPPGIDGSANTTGTYMYFGSWPQTVKASGVELTEMIKTMGANTYYLGSDGYWYAKVTAKPYISGYTFTDGTTVKKDDVYYFKVEPIKWRVLESGKLLAESILANVAYYPADSKNRTIDSETVYPNNYQHSRIRAYLNGLSYYQSGNPSTNTEFENKGFLQTAFTDTAQNKIKETAVDNSAGSTTDNGGSINGSGTNQYACGETSDKIYLLSELEVTNFAKYHFGSFIARGTSTLRLRTVSDYARATGAYMSSEYLTTEQDYRYRGWWWLRSPCYEYRSEVLFVNETGATKGSMTGYFTCVGVVPALTLAP